MQVRNYYGRSYIHSGKKDYDDCFDVSSNATKKRTMRREKKKYRRMIDKFSQE